MYIVYKAQGEQSHQAYYAYTEGNTVDDARKTFLSHASVRSDEMSGDYRLFHLNNKDPNLITFDILETFEDEVSAYIYRNMLRTICHNTVTGTSTWPTRVAQQIKQSRPPKKAKKKKIIQQLKTARQAWANGKWSKNIISGLIDLYDRDDIVYDLDNLTPNEFELKYSI
ncbi:MAG: hypothetical protein EO766_11730 [Hydrotalea sp. AMD]|uniref:hypothetical protein n=1 Tax=Hydrotalea sp. AMD TaxID=2501297 RepID=UPI00102799DC|nr:hypothetical protein [Hydrotalea sp. AMD]RWZ87194.1 MAG: hypothetical protein EO766_11730 [Hydrotalea sp. AMD]